MEIEFWGRKITQKAIPKQGAPQPIRLHDFPAPEFPRNLDKETCMKKWYPLRLPAVIGLASLISLLGCESMREIEAITIEDVSPANVRDGTYEGERSTTLVSAKVSVDVKGGKIVAIRLLEHKHGPRHGADGIIPKVLNKQSLSVDAVSGSTGSSKVVLKSIELALRKGL